MQSSAADDVSRVVLLWWATISVVSVVNIALWIALARGYLRRRATLSPTDRAAGRTQLALAGIYVFVCAFRSFVPRADVQRICFVDSVWACVFVGRSVATIAELSFIAQLVWTARRLARAVDAPSVLRLAAIPLLLIVIAETCSWYAVLSTNYVGNFIEQSLWMISGALLGVCLLVMRRRCTGSLKRLMTAGAVVSLVFFGFMLLVDVRMYLARLAADSLERRRYLALGDGLLDAISRRVVTFAWRDWHEELAWMFLYFTATVWLSLFLAAASYRPLPPPRAS